jgi:hypothetical protein
MDMLLFKEEGFVVHGKERISSQRLGSVYTLLRLFNTV